MRRGHSDVAGFPMYGAGEPDWHEQSSGDDPVHRRRVRRQPDDAEPAAGSQKLAHAEKGRLQRHVVQGGHAGDEIEALTVEFGYGQGVPVEDRRLRSAGGAPVRLDGIERRRGLGGIRGSAGERIGNGHAGPGAPRRQGSPRRRLAGTTAAASASSPVTVAPVASRRSTSSPSPQPMSRTVTGPRCEAASLTPFGSRASPAAGAGLLTGTALTSSL